MGRDAKERLTNARGVLNVRIEGKWYSPNLFSYWLISLGSGLLTWDGDGPSNTGLYALEASSGEYKR